MRKRMVGAMGVAVALAGCGSSADYANDARPAAPRMIGVSVVDDRVKLSPARLGAGPARLLITNLTSRARDVTLSAPDAGDSACVDADAASGPINPMGVARIAVELVEGECVVAVRGARGIRPARLTVGRPRPSAQGDVLLP